MQNNVSNYSITLKPGLSLKIAVPVVAGITGSFVYPEDTFSYNGETKQMVNGFFRDDENDEYSTLTPLENEFGVVYTQKVPKENFIACVTRLRSISFVHIISTVIHDHSSVTQGGPAYGTFFTDDVMET